jgi:hypothetical protein
MARGTTCWPRCSPTPTSSVRSIGASVLTPPAAGAAARCDGCQGVWAADLSWWGVVLSESALPNDDTAGADSKTRLRHTMAMSASTNLTQAFYQGAWLPCRILDEDGAAQTTLVRILTVRRWSPA